MDHRHYKIHKPYGYLSQFINNQDRRRNKKLLGELGNFPPETMAIGRLDEKSEGLLLLTTDGTVSEHIRSKSIEKEYYVQVSGTITDEAITALRAGTEIAQSSGTYTTLPCSVHHMAEPTYLGPPHRKRSESHGPASWLSITLTEGKYRQIRKMTAAVGYDTVRLIRIRIGDVLLGTMKSGEVEELLIRQGSERV